MPGRKKKTSSSRPGRGKAASRKGNRPIDFNEDKYDNPSFKLALVFEGDTPLTISSLVVTVPTKSFRCGYDEPSLHAVLKTAIYDALKNTISRVYTLDEATLEGLHDLVEQVYQPTNTGDSRFFGWRVLGSDTRYYDPTALSKFLAVPSTKERTVLCTVPTSVKEHIHALVTSVFYDEKRQPDEFFKKNLDLFPFSIAAGFSTYEELQSKGNSPVKHFRDTIVQGVDGFWTSSLALYHAAPVLNAPSTPTAGGTGPAEIPRGIEAEPRPVDTPATTDGIATVEQPGASDRDSNRPNEVTLEAHNTPGSTLGAQSSTPTTANTTAPTPHTPFSAFSTFSQAAANLRRILSPSVQTLGSGLNENPRQTVETVNEEPSEENASSSSLLPEASSSTHTPPDFDLSRIEGKQLDMSRVDRSITDPIPEEPDSTEQRTDPPSVPTPPSTTDAGQTPDSATDAPATDDGQKPASVLKSDPPGNLRLGASSLESIVEDDGQHSSPSSMGSGSAPFLPLEETVGDPLAQGGKNNITTDTDATIEASLTSLQTLARLRDGFVKSYLYPPFVAISDRKAEMGIFASDVVRDFTHVVSVPSQLELLHHTATVIAEYLVADLIERGSIELSRSVIANINSTPTTSRVFLWHPAGPDPSVTVLESAITSQIMDIMSTSPSQDTMAALHYIADGICCYEKGMLRGETDLFPLFRLDIPVVCDFVEDIMARSARKTDGADLVVVPIREDDGSKDSEQASYHTAQDASRQPDRAPHTNSTPPASTTPTTGVPADIQAELLRMLHATPQMMDEMRREHANAMNTMRREQNTHLLRIRSEYESARRHDPNSTALIRAEYNSMLDQFRAAQRDAQQAHHNAIVALRQDFEQKMDLQVTAGRAEIRTLARMVEDLTRVSQQAHQARMDAASRAASSDPSSEGTLLPVDPSPPLTQDPHAERTQLRENLSARTDVPAPADASAQAATASVDGTSQSESRPTPETGPDGQAPSRSSGDPPAPATPTPAPASPGASGPSGSVLFPNANPGPLRPPPPPGPPGGPPGAAVDDPEPLRGIDWREHRIDPAHIHSHLIRFTSGIRTILPWTYPRDETGTTVNFPVRLDVGMVNRDQFFLQLGNTHKLGTDNYPTKTFFYQFPKLPENASKSDVCQFYSAVVDHCTNFGVFVPPFHTHRPHTTMGSWFESAPEFCRQIAARNYYDRQLLQALTSKSTALAYTTGLRPLVKERRGYELLFKMARYCGHPALTDSLQLVSMPVQRSNMDLFDYNARWQHYAYIQFCHGVSFSDRYYTECLIQRLHSVYDNNLKPFLWQMFRDLPRDKPVSHHWWPEHLVDHIVEQGSRIGLTLTSETTPKTATAPKPRSATTAERATPRETPIREVSTSELPSEDIRAVDEIYINKLATDHGVAFAINSLIGPNHSADKNCHFCGDSSHLLNGCPIFQAILADPARRRFVLNVLTSRASNRGGTTNSRRPDSSRATTPPRRNIRSLDTSGDTDDEHVLSVSRLTDDELTDEHTDDETDFP